MATETTLSLIVKQLQFFSQEISTLKQHREEQQREIDAAMQLNEDQQQEIDALKAHISLRIDENETRLSSVEASLSKLDYSVSSASAAVAPSIVTAPQSSKRARNSTSLHRLDATTSNALSSHAAVDDDDDDLPSFKKRKPMGVVASTSALAAAASSSRNRSKASHWGVSYEDALSDSDADRNFNGEESGTDDDDDDSGGGRDSMTTQSTTPSSNLSAVGGNTTRSLVTRAASAAWTAAIAAVRARVTLLDTHPLSRISNQTTSMSKAQSDLDSLLKRPAASTLSITAAASRLAEATTTVTSTSLSLGNLQREKVDKKDLRYSLTMNWANAAQAAEDAALRWVAAAEIARGPAELDAAVGGASSIVSQAAAAALTSAVATARVRVDLAGHFMAASSSRANSYRESLREAKRGLFTAEYRLATANPSAAAADSRLAEATSSVTAARASVGSLLRNKVDKKDPRYSLTMTWANAAQAAEDAALRWAAVVEVARDPAPTNSESALGHAISRVSQAANTSLTTAVAAARIRVDLLNCISHDPSHLRDAKRDLYTAEYRLAMVNPSAAAATSRLAEAKAALHSAHQSNGHFNKPDRAGDDLPRTLASDWLKATGVAVAAAEKWVAAVAAADALDPQPAQAPQRSSSKKR